MAGYSRDPQSQSIPLPPITSQDLPAALGLSTSLPTTLHPSTSTTHTTLHHQHAHSLPHQPSIPPTTTGPAPPLDSRAAARCQTLQDLHDSATSSSLRNIYSCIIRDYHSGRIVWRPGAGYLYSTAGVLLLGPLSESELKQKIVELFNAGVYDVYSELCDGEPIAQMVPTSAPGSRL
ncbi:hypothetical protein TWF696_004101 [Orbilia brochopaga]|uniref:Uncharacterized protein n=1 Tax=Orbilia brochopaga TaxID=3140254 RepID=A0AAV9V5V0_9PEZI